LNVVNKNQCQLTLASAVGCSDRPVRTLSTHETATRRRGTGEAVARAGAAFALVPPEGNFARRANHHAVIVLRARTTVQWTL